MATEFAWGFMTPQQVNTINRLWKIDEERKAKKATRNALADMGHQGQNRGNMSRDIFTRLPRTRLPKLRHFRVPVRHKLLGRGNPQLPFLLPHELFSAIYHKYPKSFLKLIAPPGQVEKFWDDVKGGHRVLVGVLYRYDKISEQTYAVNANTSNKYTT
jgi:hypothetical protein